MCSSRFVVSSIPTDPPDGYRDPPEVLWTVPLRYVYRIQQGLQKIQDRKGNIAASILPNRPKTDDTRRLAEYGRTTWKSRASV